MKQINISIITNSDTFDTLAKADMVLAKITKETETISLRFLEEVMSAPLHHMIISLCIREGYGLEFVKKIRFDCTPCTYQGDKVVAALKFAEEIYGQTKPSSDNVV